MSEGIPPQLYKLLKKSLKDGIEDFFIELTNNIDGVGYSGEVLFVTLTNKKSLEKQFLAIKQVLSNDGKPVKELTPCYINEIYFYDVIWPTLHSFYTKATGKVFSFISECLGTVNDGILGLAFKNLHFAGFKTTDKTKVLGDDHFKLVFKVYGVFHGISMAFKEKNPKEYFALVENIHFGWKEVFAQMPVLDQYLQYALKNSPTHFNQETEIDIIEKLRVYDGLASQYMAKLTNEESPHRVIKHGDCWCCNMMFRYNDNGQVEDIRLIDFQVIGSGSPVHDLSYCFYAGTDCFSNLHKYLKIYHTSLSDTLKEFGLDVGKVYPFDTLIEEWKKHGKFGFFFALMSCEMRFADPTTVPHLLKEKEFIPWKIPDYNAKKYTKRIRDLVIHMYENDFL